MEKKILGNYEIIKQIGEGAFARTYLAKHVLLGEKACLKQNIDLTPEDEEMLFSEAKLLWRVHHHSLPTLRDLIKCDDGSCIMVMTFIEGKDLYKIVTEDYPKGIDPEHICWMTQRLLHAIHYLHFYGIIHGDVKPQNIIIQPKDHNAVLVDYGLSKVKPDRFSKPSGCTPAFASPEQIEGSRPPIPEMDIYGLGATMLFALGGHLGAKTFPKSVPTKLQNFFNQMLVCDISKRPKDAEKLVPILSDLRMKLFGRRSSRKDLIIS